MFGAAITLVGGLNEAMGALAVGLAAIHGTFVQIIAIVVVWFSGTTGESTKGVQTGFLLGSAARVVKLMYASEVGICQTAILGTFNIVETTIAFAFLFGGNAGRQCRAIVGELSIHKFAATVGKFYLSCSFLA